MKPHRLFVNTLNLNGSMQEILSNRDTRYSDLYSLLGTDKILDPEGNLLDPQDSVARFEEPLVPVYEGEIPDGIRMKIALHNDRMEETFG